MSVRGWGFVGLGTMGEPMALNLLRAGRPLVVWNRTADRARVLEAAGAVVADDVDDLFARVETVVLMLSTGEAVDAVLGRATGGFASRVAGHTIVNMGTSSPGHSRDLDRDLRSAGARYVEAPVSGQRGPARAGQLVAMLAGDDDLTAATGPLLGPMCSKVFFCGAVPGALSTKFALSVFQGTMMAALAEAVNYARHSGLDLERLSEVLGASPLASDLLRAQLPKLVRRDFAVLAALETVVESGRTILAAADEAGVAVPLLTLSHEIYAQARHLGTPDAEDVTSVIRAFEDRVAPPTGTA